MTTATKKSKAELEAQAAEIAARFDALPDDQHVRVRVVAEISARSIPTVWRHVKAGILPAPKRISPGLVAWRVGDLRKHLREAA